MVLHIFVADIRDGFLNRHEDQPQRPQHHMAYTGRAAKLAYRNPITVFEVQIYEIS